VYYVTLGPTTAGSGFGAGGFGFRPVSAQAQRRPALPAHQSRRLTGHTDNWGEIYMACPAGGPIYIWAPDFGFQNAQVINTAPFFNGGIYISMPQQILVAWGSVQSTGVQEPVLIRWCNAGDYTNWTVSNQDHRRLFSLSRPGRLLSAGYRCPQFALISTDIDVYTQTYGRRHRHLQSYASRQRLRAGSVRTPAASSLAIHFG